MLRRSSWRSFGDVTADSELHAARTSSCPLLLLARRLRLLHHDLLHHRFLFFFLVVRPALHLHCGKSHVLLSTREGEGRTRDRGEEAGRPLKENQQGSCSAMSVMTRRMEVFFEIESDSDQITEVKHRPNFYQIYSKAPLNQGREREKDPKGIY